MNSLATITPISTIAVSHRLTATMHTPRVGKPVATVTDIAAKVRKRDAKAMAPELKANQQRKTKTTTRWNTAGKNRFESAVFELNFSTWELGNPPRMLTFVVRGSAFRDSRKRDGSSEVFFQDVAPEMAALVKLVRDDFSRRIKSAFGIELDAIFVVEFQMYGNPHFHIFLQVPSGVSNHPMGGRGNLSRFNGYEFKQWAELTLADLSGQRPDLTRASGQGRVTHLLEAHQIAPADSIEDYVARFVNYARKDSDQYAAKTFQHATPAPYRGQHFSWWGIIGFKNARRSAAAPEVLTCRTIAADVAARNFFRSLSTREVTTVTMPNGEEVDSSMWSVELYRHCLTGGTFERPLTVEELRRLRRVIIAANQIDDLSSGDPSTEPLSAPESVSVGVVEEPAVEEEVRPLCELLELCGFTEFEQRAAMRTARRQARNHERKTRALVDTDDRY